jgi:hypothetical protein
MSQPAEPLVLGVSSASYAELVDQIMDEHDDEITRLAVALDRAWIDKQRRIQREDEAGSEQ